MFFLFDSRFQVHNCLYKLSTYLHLSRKGWWYADLHDMDIVGKGNRSVIMESTENCMLYYFPIIQVISFVQ